MRSKRFKKKGKSYTAGKKEKQTVFIPKKLIIKDIIKEVNLIERLLRNAILKLGGDATLEELVIYDLNYLKSEVLLHKNATFVSKRDKKHLHILNNGLLRQIRKHNRLKVLSLSIYKKIVNEMRSINKKIDRL